jgi:hypothetical protein
VYWCFQKIKSTTAILDVNRATNSLASSVDCYRVISIYDGDHGTFSGLGIVLRLSSERHMVMESKRRVGVECWCECES